MLIKNLWNKKFFTAWIASFFFLFSGCDLFSYRLFTKPVLQIEDKKMSVQEFSQRLAEKLSSLDPLSAKDPKIIADFKKKIEADFVVDGLIEVWFESTNQKIEPKELEEEAQAIIRNYPDDKSFREELAALDLSQRAWMSKIELSLKRKTLFKALQSKIEPISDAELQNYYENNKPLFSQRESVLAKSILVKDEAQAEVITKLSQKRKFEDLVQEFTLDAPPPKDGVYGWVERDVSPDLDLLFSGNTKGGLIGPIQFNEGFRLFKIVQKRPARTIPFEESKTRARREVVAIREAARFSAWLDEQSKRYKIFKNTYAIDSLRVETRDR